MEALTDYQILQITISTVKCSALVSYHFELVKKVYWVEIELFIFV